MNQVNSPKLSYRSEIDGLRAIAVVSVILYHAQFILFGKDWFEGGFIGVDIFFVISGYLVTRIILFELKTKGSFSAFTFFERRARRIFPMLFVVIIASIPFAWKKLLPTEFVEYAESILASIFFGSNFFFYFSTTEYGADSALLKPFLHTWSLGIEEQFYLVFPIIVMISFKFFWQHFLTILLGLSLVSLQFADLMEVWNPDLNFYLPFGRFWELSVGSMLALNELDYKTPNQGIFARIFPLVGLYLIAHSILFFDSTTPHPSFNTIIPVLGVALIICFSSENELVGKLLGSKLFVWIGLISYSAYLFHYPIFAFSRMGTHPTNVDKFQWIILTFFLSSLSYFLVEKPFRSKKFISSKQYWFALFIVFTLTSFFMLYSIRADGITSRFPKIEGFQNFEIDNGKLKKNSWMILNKRSDENPTFFDVKNKVLLVGNSHAKDLFNALTQNKTENGQFDYLVSMMPNIACANEKVADYTEMREKFYSSDLYKDATAIVVSTRFYEDQSCDKPVSQQQSSSDLAGLRFLIPRVKADGKKIVVMGNTAEFGYKDGRWVADYVYDLYGRDNDMEYEEKFNRLKAVADSLLYENATNATEKNSKIKEISEQFGAIFWDKVPLICNENSSSCDALTKNGYKTLYDYGHWTLEGAKLFGKRLLDDNFLEDISIN